jgi:hypothetical protein
MELLPDDENQLVFSTLQPVALSPCNFGGSQALGVGRILGALLDLRDLGLVFYGVFLFRLLYLVQHSLNEIRVVHILEKSVIFLIFCNFPLLLFYPKIK